MKITAGFHSVEDYIPCVEAGADELFFGCVPPSWQKDFPRGPYLNRREVLYCGVQLGGENDLRILSSMVKDYGVPAALTLNTPQYTETQREAAAAYAEYGLSLGFRDVIAADPELIRLLFARGLTKELRIHVSGEYGEMSPEAVRLLRDRGVRRIIFPRHMTPAQMKLCTEAGEGLEFEAFILNEKCHFHGAYCRSLHSDAFPPLCRVPYKVIDRNSGEELTQREREPAECPGESGCGLCMLPELQQSGVGWGKIVGRGNTTENILRDIRCAALAREVLASCGSGGEYRREMKKLLFPEGCSGNCYYEKT